MKNNLAVKSRASGVERQPGGSPSLFRPQPSTLNPQPVSAFTLIELLVVISIMATLAALLLPVVGAIKKRQYIYNTQAEMAKLETAIDRYKAAYGFYPPGNTNSLINQLYFELVGTTNSGGVYHTLDGSAQIPASQVPVAFPGVGGFMNCSKPSGGEDSSAARSFLSDLRPKQVAAYTNVNFTNILLVASVDGPDANYRPLGVQDVNPWRYVCPGTNNPGSYDLWVQLSIAGKNNLICNWSKQVRTDSPLP